MTFNGISSSLLSSNTTSSSLSPSLSSNSPPEVQTLDAKLVHLGKVLDKAMLASWDTTTKLYDAQTKVIQCQARVKQYEQVISSLNKQIVAIKETQKAQLTLATSTNTPHTTLPSGSQLATLSNSKNEAFTTEDPINLSIDDLSEISAISPMETTDTNTSAENLPLKSKNLTRSTPSAVKRKLPSDSDSVTKKAKYSYYSHPIIFKALKDKLICINNPNQSYIMKSYDGTNYQVEKSGELVKVCSGSSFYLPEIGETILIRPSHSEPPKYYKAEVKKVVKNRDSATLTATLDISGEEKTLRYHSLTKVLPFSQHVVDQMEKKEAKNSKETSYTISKTDSELALKKRW